MAIPDDKARLITTLPDKLKSDFELLCETDKRTASKELEFILEYYFNNVEKRLTFEDYQNYYNNVYLRNQLIDKIYYFCTRKNGQYEGQRISAEYFYETFKNDNITEFIVESAISLMKNKDMDVSNILLKFIEYYNNQKKTST